MNLNLIKMHQVCRSGYKENNTNIKNTVLFSVFKLLLLPLHQGYLGVAIP